MATNAFIVHKGSLDGDEELTGRLGLTEGQTLFVVSSNDQDIVLRRKAANLHNALHTQDWKTAWEALQQNEQRRWTPEWQAKAEERKQSAIENLDKVYADPSSGATEMKAAERELEFANDELMGGPYSER